MGFDTLKQYKVKIGADTTEFLKELNKLESEATKKLKDLSLSDGLRNDIEKLTREIGDMKKTLVSATDDINTNINNISTNKMKKDFKDMTDSVNGNIESLNTKMTDFQKTLDVLKEGKFDGLTDGLNKSLGTLSESISKIIGEFSEMSKFVSGIKIGTIDPDVISDASVKSTKKKAQDINNDVTKLVNSLKDNVNNLKKIRDRKTNNIDHIIGFDTTDSFDAITAAKHIKTLTSTILKEANKLSKIPSVDLSSIFKGITYEDISYIDEDISDFLKENVHEVHENVKKNMPKNIDTDIRFRIKLDEDVKGTATVTSIVNKVNEVVSKAQKEIEPIRIPIGYKTDTSDIDKNDKKELEKAEKDNYLYKKLKVDIQADTKTLANQVNSEILKVNNELKSSGKKIEVEVVGKVNQDTIEQSSKEMAYELEDAVYKNAKGLNIKGGSLSVDSSSGIATETTLSDIKTILSQWNATGIPGTQSKEFKEQLKAKADNDVVSSDFDKYFRKFVYKPTKQQKDIQNTTDFLESTLAMRLDKKEALKVLKRNRTLKKGGQEGLDALHASEYYNKSVTIDGKEYSAFETGTTLKDWQARLNKMFTDSFDDAGKIIGGLFDVTQEVNGKKKKIKGYLQTQIDKVDRDNKSTRESLRLNGVNYKKDKYGKYTDEIIYESGTVTSTEDAYAKTKNVVDRIKADAEAEYQIQIAKTNELVEQRDIMQQIYDLEQKQKSSPLSQEDNDLLISLKQDLGSRVKEISDKDKYNKLIEEQRTLQEKRASSKGLTSPEYTRLKEVEKEIQSLFKEVDDLSGYVVKQMATDADTGLSFIDKRIEEANKAAREVVKKAQQSIGQVFNPVDENNNKNANTITVKSQAQYDFYEKEIERLRERNGYLSRLVKQGKDGKNDYSAMTSAEKAEYFSNKKHIEALKARNLLYAEQHNLEQKLLGNADQIVIKETAKIKSLHVSDSEKSDYEKVYSDMHNSNVNERSYLSSLSDEEFDKAMAAFVKVNKAIDDQTKLSNEEIKALVQARIDEDIAYLKKSLEQEEAELAKLEKDPKASQKAKDNKQYRINRISSSIEQLENPNYSNKNKYLDEARNNLNIVEKERADIIAKIREENGLTEEHIALLLDVLELNKQIDSNKQDLYDLYQKINNSKVVGSVENTNSNSILGFEADDLQEDVKILKQYIKSLEDLRSKSISILSDNTNDKNLLQKLGISTDIIDDRLLDEASRVLYDENNVESVLNKYGILVDSEGNVVERVKDLAYFLDKQKQDLQEKRNNITAKINNSKVSNMPTSRDKLFSGEAGDLISEEQRISRNINNIDVRKAQLYEELLSYSGLSKDEFDKLLVELQETRRQAEVKSERYKVDKTSYIQNSDLLQLSAIDSDYHDSLANVRAEEAKMLGITMDEWIGIIERESEKAKKIGATFVPEKYVKENAFKLYEERSALYTDQITHMDDASVDTARKHLELAKEIAIEREKEKQRIAEIHEEQKQLVEERQKELRLTDKAYREQHLSPFGSKDESNVTEGSIGEVRAKVNAISEEIKSLNEEKIGFDNKIEETYKKSGKEFLVLAERERQIEEQKKERLEEIANLQEKLKDKKKTNVNLVRNEDETDESYQDRVSKFKEREQKERLLIEEKLKTLREKNTIQLKDEKKELKEIAKERQKLVKKYGDTTGLTSDGLLNNVDSAYSEYEQIKNKYDSARSRLGDSDEEVIKLGKELKASRDKYIESAAKYFASGSVDNIDDALSKRISKLRAEEKKKNKDKPKDIYLDSEKAIFDEQKKRLDAINKIQEKINEASKSNNQKNLVSLQKELNKQQLDHNNLVEIEERQLLKLRFEKQSQLKLDEQTADLRKQSDNKSQEIANAQVRKNAAESELKLQIQAREEAEKRLATNKEIKAFQTGMNSTQKKASLGVDLQLMHIQDLQKELSETPVGTEQYKALEQQISEAKRELKLFRQEAEELGLTLSGTSGRMFLNSDTGLTGLEYTGLFKDHSKDIAESDNRGYAPSKEDIARQKEMSKEQVKAYHRHSDIVDAVRAESNERQRLWKMHYIAGMNDDQAEVTLEIQKTVASVKDWNKATLEQKQQLKELHDKAKSFGLKIQDNNYVEGIVYYNDFKSNPDQYLTNKYIKGMMSSPTGSYSNRFDISQVTNLRLATESTLQNIQHILQSGIQVKVVDYIGKKYGYQGLHGLPDINGDKDPYRYLENQKKNKKQNQKKDSNNVYSEEKEAKKRLGKILNNVKADVTEKQKAIDEVLAKGWQLGYVEKQDSYFVARDTNKHASLDVTKQYAEKYGLTVDESKIGSVEKSTEKIKVETEVIKENTKATEENNKAKREPGVYDDESTVKQINSDLKQAKSILARTNISDESRKKWEDIQKAAIAEAENRGLQKNEHGFYDDISDEISKQEAILEILEEHKQRIENVVSHLEKNSDVNEEKIKEAKKELEVTNANIEAIKQAKETTTASDTTVSSDNVQETKEETNAIEEKTEALKKEWEVEKGINEINRQLSRSNIKPETREKWENVAKFNGFEIDSSSGLAKLTEDIREATVVQEKLNEETRDYQNIREAAYANGLDGALDIYKTTSYDKKGNKKVSYTANDIHGNSISADEFGEVQEIRIKKTKEVVEQEAKELKSLMSEVNSVLNNGKVNEINSYMSELLPDGEAEKVNKLKTAYEELSNVFESFEKGEITNLTEEEFDNILGQINTINKVKTQFSGNAVIGKIDTSQIVNMQSYLTKLAQEFEEAGVSNVKFSKNNQEMTYQLVDGNNMLNTYRLTVQRTGEVTRDLIKSEKNLNTFQRLMSATGKKFGEIFNYMVASTSIYEIFNFFRRGISVVQEFDKAMTELYKVANDSTSALERFGKEAYDVAKQVGRTGVEIINSAADWAKLGYSINEASELAKNSALYANVGDMEIGTATEHMVSTLKAFNVEAKDSITIVDKFNEIGNNYAITSEGIGAALERSASSLVAAGNDIDQAIALITTGNIISQDPESVGNAIKVLSLRIRGSKTELEEMGEETDGLASSTSKLRSEIKSLTGVDIMLDDNTYKDTYTILLEISKVWDKLSDVSQANVLEKLAGKTRSSVVAGLLQQGETLEKVYKDSKDSAGSAEKENERYLESIQGHLDQLANKWQEIWSQEITRDFINTFIDLGKVILEVVDFIGLIPTAIAAVSTLLYAKGKNKNGGGRVKKFTLITNMPPNRLAERCASSGVYRNDNICSL